MMGGAEAKPAFILFVAIAALAAGLARAAGAESFEVPWQPGNAPAFQLGAAEERGARAANGQLPVRIYRPAGAGPFPFVVLLHGCGGLHRDAMWKLWVEPWAVSRALPRHAVRSGRHRARGSRRS